ncbi:MAG: hypothetical protein HFG34_01740 [Eubacterium sp.]|nr:hypothetical protein [Eubacterium sp.]
MTLPHDWSIFRDFDSSIATAVGSLKGGNGWYRKAFVLPEDLAGKRICIDFDGVYQDSYIYVNGRLVGNYPNGYIPDELDLVGLNYGEYYYDSLHEGQRKATDCIFNGHYPGSNGLAQRSRLLHTMKLARRLQETRWLRLEKKQN